MSDGTKEPEELELDHDRDDLEEEDEDIRHPRDRKADIAERPLSPRSLVGSWFIHLENGEAVEEGLIVAEPQPGAYLLDAEVRPDPDRPGIVKRSQRLVEAVSMIDKDGSEWRFYDQPIQMREAYLYHDVREHH